MISIDEAISIVKNNSKTLQELKTIKVEKAFGYLLAEDIVSPIDMPPFRQSAMDGYAICSGTFSSYTIIGEVKAGDSINPELKPGEAVRIFTGAAVPDTADVILIQEKVTVKDNELYTEEEFKIAQNIRPKGEQVQKGEVALQKGAKIVPATVGYLYSLGIDKVSVIKKPSVAIVSTGNELIEAGEELKHGQIYESNSAMLTSALYSLKFYDTEVYKIEDNYEATLSTLRTVLKNHDLVLITGGISVGEYDFVGRALKELEVNELFYKVKQKPGKPLFYGKKDETQIFALPGNPAASLSCFYIYVYIVLQKMMGKSTLELPRVESTTLNSFIKKGDRPQFLKAIYNNGKVELLEGQNSSMLQTFAVSNALVFVPGEVSEISINDKVETILLPV
ncbi:gephyrin-like molybdotransferase Glp [Tenacibaculum sp. 190524A05c]|uniref:Molybdopterin molybdenumtransferase n=1 Tax=Tenacibaculum platacis TaxID=3137852 RepID=A0ABM9NTA5_9FLAO